MHSSVSSTAQPEAILEWLQKEMEYRPLGPYIASNKASTPSADSMRKICRGNMIPVWTFLLKRVKSEKTVENIRRNILVHGGDDNSIPGGDASKANDVGRNRGRKKEKVRLDEEASSSNSAENARKTALHERDLAEKEVERLGHVLRRQRRELKERMLEVSREEAERKRMLDERSNYRHKQVMLEAYEQQCDEAVKIFAEYHKRFQIYVSEARDSQRLKNDPFNDMKKSFSPNSEKGAFYSTVKGNKQADDIILLETARERNIRKACESLSMQMIEKIRISFPAYEGNGIHLNPQVEAAKLGINFDEDIPDEVKHVALNCLKSPPLLLQGIIGYTKRLEAFITRENEKIDIRSDAETLRYKYENNRVMNASSSDPSSPLQYQLIGNGKITAGAPSSGSPNQIFERQNAHVQQILVTEDALNKAAEARNQCQKLIKRLHGSDDLVSSQAPFVGGTSHNVSSLRQLEFDVWAKERDVAGLRASLSTLMSEVQRLNKSCAERKEAEDSLRKKWNKIEEFDARRSELEFIYNALLRATTDAAAFWSQQPLAAREYASSTIVPACTVVLDISNRAKDFIEKEVSAFYSCPDNRLCMLPSTPQALLDSMGISSTGPEAVATAEKNAALLTARAGARDPSAIPSICRISASLQYPAGLEGSDAGLASVLESLEFCLKLRGSEACILEDLVKAMNTVHIRRDLVESGHALLNHASRAQQEYERTANSCLDLAAEQENAITDKWIPELRNACINAKKCLEDCKYIRGLVDEWWEQPASTIVDWVAVDGENVGAWINHVKQLLTFYDK